MRRETSFEQEWPALVERIERAQIAGDFQVLINARTDCRQWLDGVLTDRQRAPGRYTVAYANWRLPSPSLALDDDARDELGDDAVELLGEEHRGREGDIESHALLGGVWEIQIPDKQARTRPRRGQRTNAVRRAGRST